MFGKPGPGRAANPWVATAVCTGRILYFERRLLPLVPLAGVLGFGCKVPLITILLSVA